MKIYLGSDHAGFELKEQIKEDLIEKQYDIVDCGAHVFNKNDDYSDFISIVGKNVGENTNSYGIVFGKSGAGECMVANKTKGARAVLGFSKENVALSRLHNNANILSLGSMFVNEELGKELVRIFLETKFTNEERHVRRINKIKEIEKLWH